MKSTRQGSWRWKRRLAGWLLLALAGCATRDYHVEQALHSVPAAPDPVAEKNYQIYCPDVVEVQVSGPHPWQGERTIGPDGRVQLEPMGAVRVDGLTPPQAAARIAAQLGVMPDQVGLKVAAFKSQQVYLYGEVAGHPRAVAYRGPETVLELLQRAGGLAPGASFTDIQVVRTHVADGKQPEVFQIDLAAILLKKDAKSNVRLEPSDQVYVGSTKRYCLVKCLPPWLRSLCKCGAEQTPAPASLPAAVEVAHSRPAN